jgi:hypothetical protein
MTRQQLLDECHEIKASYFLRDEITRDQYIALIDAWMEKARRCGLGRQHRHKPRPPRRRSIERVRRKWAATPAIRRARAGALEEGQA